MGRDQLMKWGLVVAVAPSSSPIGGENGGGAPALFVERGEEREWRHNIDDHNSSVNAVSFGFVATAILISMFLIMAIFERFLRSSSSSSPSPSPPTTTNHHHLQTHHMGFNGKLALHPSPKMSIYSKGVSVLMPGDKVPTYIAHLAPPPCPPEPVAWPTHQHDPAVSSGSNAT